MASSCMMEELAKAPLAGAGARGRACGRGQGRWPPQAGWLGYEKSSVGRSHDFHEYGAAAFVRSLEMGAIIGNGSMENMMGA